MCVALKSHAWKHETENMKPKSAVFLHSTEKQWNLQIVKRNHASMSGSLRFAVKADSVTNDRISSGPRRDFL